MDPLQLRGIRTPYWPVCYPLTLPTSEALRTLAPQGQLNKLRFSRDAGAGITGCSVSYSKKWQRWRMVPGLHAVDATFRLSLKGVALH